MKVIIDEIHRVTVSNVYNIDIEEYKEWLNDRESDDDTLLDYIYDSINEPTDYWEEDSEFISSYVSNDKDLHNIVNNTK